MNRFEADLHIHTVLSPCASEEMNPMGVVRQALGCGLSIVAICDHNASANAVAVRNAAAGMLFVVCGIEVTTSEEVHLVGLFNEPEQADRVASRVLSTLPMRRCPEPAWLGPQNVVNEAGDVLRQEPHMLYVASGLCLSDAVTLIHEHDGLAIAAHVDRPSYSVTSQLGMLPEGIGLDAIEISASGLKRGLAARFTSWGLPMVASSDSHYLEEIGAARTMFEMDSPTWDEMRLALSGVDGRRCWLA